MTTKKHRNIKIKLNQSKIKCKNISIIKTPKLPKVKDLYNAYDKCNYWSYQYEKFSEKSNKIENQLFDLEE